MNNIYLYIYMYIYIYILYKYSLLYPIHIHIFIPYCFLHPVFKKSSNGKLGNKEISRFCLL